MFGQRAARAPSSIHDTTCAKEVRFKMLSSACLDNRRWVLGYNLVLRASTYLRILSKRDKAPSHRLRDAHCFGAIVNSHVNHVEHGGGWCSPLLVTQTRA